MTYRLRLFLFGIVLLASAPAANAATRWIEIKSPHFTVISADSERQTRILAWEFEQVRAVVTALWPWARLDADRPIVIIAAPDEETMKLLVPAYYEKQWDASLAAWSATGFDRHYVAVRSDIRAGNQDGINPFY